MDKLKVGLIGGTRGFGSRRCQAFHGCERAEVAALCSRTRDELDKTADELGAKAYSDWAELIADPDIDTVAVAVPNALHFEIAKAALSAGKHTLVEYPICQSLEELDELVAIAKSRGVVLHHALTVRGEPLHRKLRELAPRIGRILHGHYRYFGGGKWYLDPKLRGDAFLALHIHFLDQFEDIIGETTRLNATLKVLGEGETNIHTGTTLQEFADGATAFQEFGMGFQAKPSYHGWYIGEKGWLGFEGNEVKLATTDGADETLSPDDVDAVVDDTANFVAQVLDGAESWVPEAQTRRTMQLCAAAAESAQTGAKIAIS